ncbi:MAG: hypothetical protein KGJ05_08575, partial [Alphaproteobacteria bacterium]|nr:hypothetical protein [Alphaproteobacteria bacterium]
DTIDFVFGVINWKEAASSGTSAKLHDEIDRVMANSAPTAAPVMPLWQDGPSHMPVTKTDLSLPEIAVADEDGLADWLAAARDAAHDAETLDYQGKSALYRALGLAYDFALVAEARPDEYAEILADAGLVALARAPMTPIVKLIFGEKADKAKLSGYAAALGYAYDLHVGAGTAATFIEHFEGGLKGVIAAGRAAKRAAASKPSRSDQLLERVRQQPMQVLIPIEGDDEFVIMVGRRIDAEHVGLVGVAQADTSLLERILKQLAN